MHMQYFSSLRPSFLWIIKLKVQIFPYLLPPLPISKMHMKSRRVGLRYGNKCSTFKDPAEICEIHQFSSTPKYFKPTLMKSNLLQIIPIISRYGNSKNFNKSSLMLSYHNALQKGAFL